MFDPVLVHHGKASYYADHFNGRRTASGERFSQRKLTAASRVLPLGSRVLVTNPGNGRTVEVVINDRGPYVRGRIIDLSRKAAQALDMIEDGVVDVRVEASPSSQPNSRARRRLVEMVARLPEAEEGDGSSAGPRPATALVVEHRRTPSGQTEVADRPAMAD